VVAEESLERAGIARALGAKQREEVGHRRRVVAGGRHDLRAEAVGLVLGVAAELQERRVQAEAAHGAEHLRRASLRVAEQSAENAEPGAGERGFRGLMRAVAQRDV
jgi:hypothetical protein